jgi:ATP-dependent Clp protease ATP-binding subunit ClpA
MDAGLIRYTAAARRVLSNAHREAAVAGHLTIDQEHILLGLVLDEGQVGAMLSKQGARIDDLRRILAELFRASQKKAKQIDLGKSTEQTLSQAVSIARKRRHKFISTEHLLMATLEQKDKRLNELMEKAGLDHDSIRAQTEQLLAQL